MQMTGKTLLNIIPHSLSPIIAKGEITPRYYNPGNLFENVHILSCSDDQPDLDVLQATAGEARLSWHTLPLPPKLIYKSFGYSPFYFQKWAKPVLELAQKIKPDLIRCYGFDFNLFPAMEIKKELGIPVVTSLHKHPFQKLGLTKKQAFLDHLLLSCIKKQIKGVDVGIGVYESLKQPLEKMNPRKVNVIYNAVHTDYAVKENYDLTDPECPSLAYVGRLMEGKNPENIIRALTLVSKARLTIVGAGPFKNDLIDLTGQLDLTDRVTFIDAIGNTELCQTLKDYDIFTLHNDYWGLPKTLLEASLAGLPVIVNTVSSEKIPEYDRGFVFSVENTPEAYASAIKQMISDYEMRKQYGLKAREVALDLWDPAKSEKKYADLYQALLSA